MTGEPWSEPGYEAIARLVGERTGLTFVPNRRQGAIAAIRRAMARAGTDDLARYGVLVARGGEALDELIAELTVRETYFFRDPAQFEVLRNQVLPEILSRRGERATVRVWSAGCASGEEAYSLAILLDELGVVRRAHIIGTDLSRGALARARRARYGRWSFRGVPDALVQTYFQQQGGHYEPAPAIRGAVEFRYLNLAEDTYPSLASCVWGMDLILCRNVLIYFDAPTVARVAGRLVRALSDDGWLLLGAADPPLGGILPCEVVVTGAGLAYRRRNAARGPGPELTSAGWRARDEVLSLAEPDPLAATRPQPAISQDRSYATLEPAQPVAAEGAAASREDPSAAVHWYAEGDYERAAESALRLVRRSDADPAAWVVLVRSLANQGDLVEAGRACAAGLDRHRHLAELHYLEALLLLEAGHSAPAAAAARRALYLDRGLAVAHLALGSALMRLGDARGARRAFANAERLLAGMEPAAVVRASDQEPAGRLAEMARVQLRLLTEQAA